MSFTGQNSRRSGSKTLAPFVRALARFFNCIPCCVLAWSFGVLGANAQGQPFSPALTQYGHAAWRVQDGGIKAAGYAVAQTRDGYLWVATEYGLERFDGTQFQPWKLPDDQGAISLLAARDGSLWVGTRTGVVHVHEGHADSVKGIAGRINGLVQDRSGAIWLVRSRYPGNDGPLCRIIDSVTRCYGAAAGIQCRYGVALAQNQRGDFLIGSDIGVCVWNPRSSAIFLTASNIFHNLQGVNAIAVRSDGSALIGFIHPGRKYGLELAVGKTLSAFKSAGLDGSTLSVEVLLIDHKGGLWIGTDSDGIYHVVNGKTDHFTTADGLTGDSINAFFEDREGNVWVGTIGGLDRFHELSVASYTTREGLKSDQVSAILAPRDGSVLMSNSTGLDILRDGKISHVGRKEGLPGESVTSLFEDSSGTVWVGVDNDLTIYRGGRFELVRKPDGSPLGVIRSLAEDAEHDIWAIAAGRPSRLYRIRSGRFLDEVRLPSEPRSDTSDPAGTLWIEMGDGNFALWRNDTFRYLRGPGTEIRFGQLAFGRDGSVLSAGHNGLYRGINRKWAVLNSANGLPCDDVLAVAYVGEDLWLQQRCGLSIVDGSSLKRFWSHDVDKPTVKMLDVTDGVRPGIGTFTPTTARSRDGRLWIATDEIALAVDPSHLKFNTLPPPVHVERIVADHVAQLISASPGISLAPLTRDVEIDYSGLSFVAPQKVQYQYRLTGLDKDWQDVGTRKSAFYMNLSPGSYVFDVKASNNDGVWSPVGDSVRFTIRPAFYQTLWFQLAIAALAVALLWFIFSLRVRSAIAQAEARLSERQAERVRIARELHDTLLQGFHGLMARFQVVANTASEPIRGMIEDVMERADSLLIESRDRVRDLRSAEEGESPLGEELKQIAFALERDGCVSIEVKLSGTPVPLNADVQHEILSIAKEALSNACKHANASAIICDLTYSRSSLILACADNGHGIDQEILRAGGRDGHWGLSGMQERARQIGTSLRIRSSPSQGTRIELRIKARIAYATRRRSRADMWAVAVS